jgi:poly(3-hydroxybutyrate) depolymerase
MMHRGDPGRSDGKIRNVALLTVEGENDDISGLGQTKAAHDLCANIPDDMRVHYMQPAVGHYGVFNGSRFRKEIVPRIVDFHLQLRQAREPQRRAETASSCVAAKG